MQNSIGDIETVESNLQKIFISDGCISIVIIYLLIIKRIHTYLTSYYAGMVLGFKLYDPKIALHFTEITL